MTERRALYLANGIPAEIAGADTPANTLPKPSTGLVEQTTLADTDQFVLQDSGGTVKKTLWSTINAAARSLLGAASIEQIAGMNPTLDLDFGRQVYRHYSSADGLREKALSEILTFTRASSATYFDAKGIMQSSASDSPRIGFDPDTQQCTGLIVEASRTNLFLNSLLDGTPLSTQTVTVTATAHTLSFYGTGSITLSGAYAATITGSSATVRTVLTFTPTAGALLCTVSGNVMWAQCEVGAYATSFIPTAGSTILRAADSPIISGTDFTDFFINGVGTVFVDAVDRSSTSGRIVTITTGSVTAQIWVAGNGVVYIGSAYEVNIGSASPLGGKIAFAFSENDAAISRDGGTISTDTACTIPNVDRLHIGMTSSGGQARLAVKRVAYWPVRLPNTVLQQLTAG